MSFRELQRIVARPNEVVDGGTSCPRAAGLLARLCGDDGGQDLIEYALLSAFIGLASVVGYQVLGDSMKSVFESWNTGVQSQWESPNPISGS